ncbi:MAG TPA: type II CAAX endopeptidase family protein [Verrucomicrobiaceae bacterium]
MSEAATLEIIRDLFGIACVALVIGIAFYGAMRAGGGPQWNCDGNVLARPYGRPDGFAALFLLAFFTYCSTARVANLEGGESAPGPNGGDVPETSLLIGMVFMLVIALTLLAYLRMRRLEPGELFGIRQMPVARALRYGAAFLFVVYLAMLGVRYLVQKFVFHGNWPDNSMQEPIETFQGSEGIFFKVVLGVAAVFIAPVAEETIFRGFLYGITKRFTDRWFAAIFTSLVFAGVHRHVGSAVPLFTLAMGFAVAYEMTGCLMVPVAMHSMFNAFNLLLLTLSPQS